MWQDLQDGRFVRVGTLHARRDGRYIFEYRHEAGSHPRFRPFLAFPDLTHPYESSSLFPFFPNRVMSARRPGYADYVRALGLDDEHVEPVELPARTGGGWATDPVHVVPELRQDDQGRWRVPFLVSGLRHIEGGRRVARLHVGQELALRQDSSNPVNPRAFLLDIETSEPVGYLPDYLVDSVHDLLGGGSTPRVFVEHVNGPEVPWHLRVLCRLEADVGLSGV